MRALFYRSNTSEMGSERAHRTRLYDALVHRRESDANTSLSARSKYRYWLGDKEFRGKFYPVTEPGGADLTRIVGFLWDTPSSTNR